MGLRSCLAERGAELDHHGRQLLTVQEFSSRARDLNIQALDASELEFYEKHCLLLPIFRTVAPAPLVLDRLQRQFSSVAGPVREPPAEWKRVERPQFLDPEQIDEEIRENPFVTKPDCSSYESWDARWVETIRSTGSPVGERLATPYYSYWQVHVVHLLRRMGYYEHAAIVRELPDESPSRRRYEPPADTEWALSFQGQAAGYEVLARFGTSSTNFWGREYVRVEEGDPLSADDTQVELRSLARDSLAATGFEEPDLYAFIGKLLDLRESYLRAERASLADEVQRDIELALQLANAAFGYDWEQSIATLGEHHGEYSAMRLRRLDPFERAIAEAKENLKGAVSNSPALTATPEDAEELASGFVDFCLHHELFEVITAVAQYTFTPEDLRSDRLPSFFYRRLRPLALSVEQLVRSLAAEIDLTSSDPYLAVVRELGRDQAWFTHFNRFIDRDRLTWDGEGDLHERAFQLSQSIAPDVSAPREIGASIALALAARNLVSHRSQSIRTEIARSLAGNCMSALTFVWVTARRDNLFGSSSDPDRS
jgi:hypothetical protein